MYRNILYENIFCYVQINIVCISHFVETMDPPSPIRRELASEQILEDMIHDADPSGAVSPSRYLNSSGEGEDINQR
jgi:hypothetical protein